MSLLEEIIQGSTEDSISTPNLLRKVQVVGTRLEAPDIVNWAKGELEGYGENIAVPDYRVIKTNVMGLFTGPMQSRIQQPLPVHEDFTRWFQVDLRQPLKELESFSAGDSDPSIPWPAQVTYRYEQTGIYRIEFYGLFQAWKVMPRERLRGIVDTVRTKAMELALELQVKYPNAGTLQGPTVSSNSEVALTVYNITNSITGDGASIAVGDNLQQSNTVRQGDLPSLTSALTALGLPEDAQEEFIEILEGDNALESEAAQTFLQRVRNGSIVLGKSVSSGVVAGTLIELGKAFIGG